MSSRINAFVAPTGLSARGRGLTENALALETPWSVRGPSGRPATKLPPTE